MASALKKITTRAKQLYKKGGSWKGAIKRAGVEYRAGKLGSVSRTKKKAAKKKKASPLKGRVHKEWGMVHKHKRRVASTESIGSLQSKIKSKLKTQLDSAVLRKFHAKKKMLKRKAQKSINQIRSALRKYSS